MISRACIPHPSGGSLEYHLGKMRKRKKELLGRDADGCLLYRDVSTVGMDEEEVAPHGAHNACIALSACIRCTK